MKRALIVLVIAVVVAVAALTLALRIHSTYVADRSTEMAEAFCREHADEISPAIGDAVPRCEVVSLDGVGALSEVVLQLDAKTHLWVSLHAPVMGTWKIERAAVYRDERMILSLD